MERSSAILHRYELRVWVWGRLGARYKDYIRSLNYCMLYGGGGGGGGGGGTVPVYFSNDQNNLRLSIFTFGIAVVRYLQVERTILYL